MATKDYMKRTLDNMSPKLIMIMEVLYKYRAIDAMSHISEDIIIKELGKQGITWNIPHQIYILRNMTPSMTARTLDEEIHKPLCLTRQGVKFIKAYKTKQKKEQKAEAKKTT